MLSTPIRSRTMSVGSHEDESLSELNKMNYFIENRDCKEPTKDEPELEMTPPLLPGEYMRFIGRSREGILGLTNYRLLQASEIEGHFRINIPIRMIDAVVGTELFVVQMNTKDGGTIRLNFNTNDMATIWRTRLTDALAPLPSLDAFFAFHFKAFLEEPENRNFRRIFDSSGSDLDLESDRIFKSGTANGESVTGHADLEQQPWRRPDEVRALVDEFRRMAFDETAWRITEVNLGYRVCETYREAHIVPRRFDDAALREALDYRAAHRFPSVTWRSRRTGAVIARCSQPGTGFFSARNARDEELLRTIVAACRANRPPAPGAAPNAINGAAAAAEPQVPEEEEVPAVAEGPSMLIVDARSYSAAFANRARGYGTELVDYYPSCRIEFGNLANIHSVRAAYDALRTAAMTTSASDFQLGISGSRWLQYLAQLLHCTRIIVDSVEKTCPVLVHCSDGWDRTPQLTALAQVCLDPFYRTLAGFRVLVEREWLAFGHKFADRCGHDASNHRANPSERSQVFVQWLDAIFQIYSQFPTAFEYNSYFLKKLAIHANSCLFGTFLLNSSKERADHSTITQTCSVWDYLRPESNWRVLNMIYHEKSAPEVLRPSNSTRDMLLWRDFYCSHWPTADSGDLAAAEPPPANYQHRAAASAEATAGPGLASASSASPLAPAEEEDNVHRIVRSRSDEALALRASDEGLMMTAASSDLAISNTSGAMISSSDTLVMRPSIVAGAGAADQTSLQAQNGHSGRGLSHCASGSSISNGMQRSYLGASCTSIEALDHSTELFTSVERHLQRQARVLAKNKDKTTAQQRINGLSSPPPNFVGLDWDGLPMPAMHDSVVVRSLVLQYERQLAVERAKRADYRRRASEAEQEREKLRSDLIDLKDEVRRLKRALNSAALGEDANPAQMSSSPCSAIAPGYFEPSAQLLDQPLALLPRDRANSGPRDLHRPYSGHSGSASDGGGHSETLSSVGSDYVRVSEHEEPQFWQPDHLATDCTSCKTEFHYLLRKHHCRKCGLVYCDACTRYRIAVPEQRCYDPVRVCYRCYEAMTSGLTTSPSGPAAAHNNSGSSNGDSAVPESAPLPSDPGHVGSPGEVSGCVERPPGRSPTSANVGRLSGRSPTLSTSSTSSSSTVMPAASKCGEASSSGEAGNGQVRASTAYVMG